VGDIEFKDDINVNGIRGASRFTSAEGLLHETPYKSATGFDLSIERAATESRGEGVAESQIHWPSAKIMIVMCIGGGLFWFLAAASVWHAL
jgi:hypothetical protein